MSSAVESGILDRLSQRAQESVLLARHEAQALHHGYIGTEHLLLGLLQTDGSASQEVLISLGVTPEGIRAQVVRIVGVGDKRVDGDPPFTPRCAKIFELALREALSLGHNYVGTEHLLLGLARENEGVAARLLLDADVDSDSLRAAVLSAINDPRVSVETPAAAQSDLKAPQTPRATTAEDASKATGQDGGSAGPAGKVNTEAIEAIPTHRDRPATEDGLGRARLASVLAERIRRVRDEDTTAPVGTRRERRAKLAGDMAAAQRAGSFMVHVHAPWGAGKSSLLNFLGYDLHNRAHEADLKERSGEVYAWHKRLFDFFLGRRRPTDPSLSQWVVVQFSAWEHQRLVAPWWWLLSAVQRACAHELWWIHRGRWLWFWIRDLVWRVWNARAMAVALLLLLLLAIAAWRLEWFGLPDKSVAVVSAILVTAGTAIALAGTVFGMVRGTSKWLAVGSADGAVRFLKRAHDPLGVYRRRFRWLVRSSGRPIVVFIDDLDRCRPEYVVELLEGIQTLFADEPVTYVIAADREWLCGSFAKTYSAFEDSVGSPGRPLGFLFLEKTFQISMEIPPMSHEQRDHYWNALMGGGENHSAGKGSTRKGLTKAFAKASTQGEVEDEVKNLTQDGVDYEEVLLAAVRRLNAPDMQEQLERLLSEFAPMVENNPRSMKRLLNAYGIERDRLLRDGYLLTKAERRQLALLTILRLRWPLFADHLRANPSDAEFCARGAAAPSDHRHLSLFADPGVRNLFDDDQISDCLDDKLVTRFPGRRPDHVV